MPTNVPHYPLFLALDGRTVVVAGGGGVAERKVETLVRHGARVVVIAPEATPAIRRRADDGSVEWHARRFEERDLDGAALAFAATGDAEVNVTVARAARRLAIPVNVADAPELCDFLVPALLEAGPIRVAISTGGSSPALARKLRNDIRSLIGQEYGELSEILGALREPAIASPALPADADRKRFFDSILDGGVLELLRQGKRREALEVVSRLCQAVSVELPEALRGRLD